VLCCPGFSPFIGSHGLANCLSPVNTIVSEHPLADPHAIVLNQRNPAVFVNQIFRHHSATIPQRQSDLARHCSKRKTEAKDTLELFL